jgi:hypothetical protein
MALTEYEERVLAEIEAHLETPPAHRRWLRRAGTALATTTLLTALALLCCAVAGVGTLAAVEIAWRHGGFGLPAVAGLLFVWMIMTGAFDPHRPPLNPRDAGRNRP